MTMLFLSFLQMKGRDLRMKRSHLALIIANIALGFAGFFVGNLLHSRDLALALFFANITPTATAAPVVMGFLGGRSGYVLTAFLVSNLVIALLMPLMLASVIGRVEPGLSMDILETVALIIFLPLGLAILLRVVNPASREWPARLKNVSFGMWVLALFLIMANASEFLRHHHEIPVRQLALTALCSMFFCLLNFSVGRLLGGKQFRAEASQSLGQKNTTLTIYLALTYANPVVALGPTMYVIWHNLWNSFQIYRYHQRTGKSKKAATH